MRIKIIVLAILIVLILLILVFCQTSKNPATRLSPETALNELISKGMLEDPSPDSYTPVEIAAVIEPYKNIYVQFIEIEELSGNGGASGYVVTSDSSGIRILGGFFGARDVIMQTAKAPGDGTITFTERQSTSACSYTEQVVLVDLSTEGLVRKGAPVEKSECGEMP